MDQAAGEGDDLGLAEVLEDPHAIAPADATEYLVLRDRLDALLDELPARERRIIELRFGLLDGHAWTLREVGKVMGLTRERVRQVEILALKQLRQSTGMGQLSVYLA